MLRSILFPEPEQNQHVIAVSIGSLLLVSAGSLATAPLLMPESYSWISNTTSESAAQGMSGAWLARFGFVVFGLAVIWIVISLRSVWARGAFLSHTVFGVLMVSTAAFSIRSWMHDAPYDPFEDFLHSFTATAMGFAFTFGVLARLLQRRKENQPGGFFDAVAIAVSTFIPLLMASFPETDGLLQRLIFLTAYLWYGREILHLRKWRLRLTAQTTTLAHLIWLC